MLLEVEATKGATSVDSDFCSCDTTLSSVDCDAAYANGQSGVSEYSSIVQVEVLHLAPLGLLDDA